MVCSRAAGQGRTLSMLRSPVEAAGRMGGNGRLGCAGRGGRPARRPETASNLQSSQPQVTVRAVSRLPGLASPPARARSPAGWA